MKIRHFFAALLFTLSPAAARDCAGIDADARTAEAGIDLDQLHQLFKEAETPASGCDGAYLAGFGDDIAKAHVNRFFIEMKSSGSGPKAMLDNIGILEAGREFGEPWQLLLTLAEIRYESSDYDKAAPLYEAAVSKMSTIARTLPDSAIEAHDLPGVDDFKMIHGRMVQSALLAKDFEAPTVTRGAPDTGLFVESWRGYAVKAVPLPVQFEFGTTGFTEKGQKAADHLLAYLKSVKKPAITLVGHTDPVGDEAANQTLSVARAEAVRDYLVSHGYAGTVTVEGRGESEPFRAIDAARFATDEEALNALDRRVELFR